MSAIAWEPFGSRVIGFVSYRTKDVRLKRYRTGSREVSLDLNLHGDDRIANLCGEQTNTDGERNKA